MRKRGRDLFDLAVALESGTADPDRIVAAFSEYMDRGDHHVMRAAFEQNLADKLGDPQFAADIGPLLAPGRSWNMQEAAETVNSRLLVLLPGEPSKPAEPIPF